MNNDHNFNRLLLLSFFCLIPNDECITNKTNFTYNCPKENFFIYICLGGGGVSLLTSLRSLVHSLIVFWLGGPFSDFILKLPLLTTVTSSCYLIRSAPIHCYNVCVKYSNSTDHLPREHTSTQLRPHCSISLP